MVNLLHDIHDGKIVAAYALDADTESFRLSARWHLVTRMGVDIRCAA